MFHQIEYLKLDTSSFNNEYVFSRLSNREDRLPWLVSYLVKLVGISHDLDQVPLSDDVNAASEQLLIF